MRSIALRLEYRKGCVSLADAGPVWEPSSHGHLQMNMRTQARIQYMQKRLFEFPSMPQSELQLLLEGWDAGEEWCFRTRNEESKTHIVP